MYNKLDASEGSTLGFRIGSKVGKIEIEAIIKELEESINQHEQIKLLVQLDHLNGMELSTLFEDVSFLARHLKHIESLAVVGDCFWEKWVTNISATVLSKNCKYFEATKIIEAWDWLKAQ